jgi:hypothetical protein
MAGNQEAKPWSASGLKMKPIYQCNLPPYAPGTHGDCLPAAVASVLGLPLDEVPHFTSENADPIQALGDWLRPRGLELASEVLRGSLPEVLARMSERTPDYYLLAGRAGQARWAHVVVCLGASIVHDPTPGYTEAGVTSIAPLPGEWFLAMTIYRRPTVADGTASSSALLQSPRCPQNSLPN